MTRRACIVLRSSAKACTASSGALRASILPTQSTTGTPVGRWRAAPMYSCGSPSARKYLTSLAPRARQAASVAEFVTRTTDEFLSVSLVQPFSLSNEPVATLRAFSTGHSRPK